MPEKGKGSHKGMKCRRVFFVLLMLGGFAHDRVFGEEVWISCGAGTGLPRGEFAEISAVHIDGEAGLDVIKLFGIPLEAGFDVRYAGYLPSSDWVKTMNGLCGIMRVGYRVPLGKRFSLIPGAGGGIQILFASSALDTGAYTAGVYTDRVGVQALVMAGIGVVFSPAETWSLGLDVDYLMTIESESMIHGMTVALSFDRRVGILGRPTSPQILPSPSGTDILASSLLPLEEDGNLRVIRNGSTITLIIEDSFGPYEAVPTERTLDQLGRVAEILFGTAIRTMVISGYVAETSDGEEDLDRELSLARAEAVRDILTTLGIVPGLKGVETFGLGTADPVADNDTAEGRARNRRVELVIEVEEED